MFVYSFKGNNIKKAAALLLAAVLIAVSGFFLLNQSKGQKVYVRNGISYKASTPEERVAFLSQFDWDINSEPIEVREVIIPEEFDDTYSQYNQIQKEQKLDLEKYKGERVKKWTYEILNYPDYENSDGIIRANLLILNGLVIGGDICSVELDGFMHGFEKPDVSPQ